MEGRPDDDPEVMALFCPQEDDGVFDPKAELDAALQHEDVEPESAALLLAAFKDAEAIEEEGSLPPFSRGVSEPRLTSNSRSSCSRNNLKTCYL